MRIINNKEWFCLVNPDRTNREIMNFLDDANATFKLLVRDEKDYNNAVVHKHLSLGMPGGMAALDKF